MTLKAQASFEQLIVVAMALAFVSVAFYLAINYSTDSTKISQAEDAAQRLAGAADHVYALGPNSKEFVTIYLPGDIRYSNITGKRILLTIGTSAGTTDVFANSKADLIGSLPSLGGKQKILVEYLPNGKVRIGEAGLVCSPPLIARSLDPGQNGEDFIYITNNAEFEVTGINASLSGTTLASTDPAPPTLASGANDSFKVSYSIPMEQPPGVYGATLLVDSANGGSCTAQITLHVSGSQTCGALCAAGGYATGSCRATESECLASGEDYKSENDPGCVGQVGKPNCCCYPTVDSWGPIVSNISHSPPNATASNPITINAICNDTSTGDLYIKSADLQLDGSNWSTMSAADGAFFSSSIENVTRLVGTLGPGQHIAAVRCTDTGNNTGLTAYYYFNVSAGDMLGPIVTSMNHSDTYPTTLANITEYCVATDMFTGNANLQRCYIKLDGGSWIQAEATDGAYDSPTEEYSYNVGQLTTGMHTVYSYCIDSLNNVGGIYNDTFGVSSADVILVMDRSGSMSETVTNAYSNSIVSTGSSSFTLVKTITVTGKNSDLANVSAEIRTGTSGCTVAFEARVGGNVIASGNRTSTSYGTITSAVNISAYSTPFNMELYLKKIYGSSCTAYNRNFRLTQTPTKMLASQTAAKLFVDLVTETTQIGLVSYSTSATTDRQLALMDSANKNALKSSIDALVASGNTCIRCGIDNARVELTSGRSRFPDAVRVAIVLTDGQSNVGSCPVTETIEGASDARGSNITIYTIGFGDDVNQNELLNTALITGGNYYYAPDEATLQCIYQHIGMPDPC